MSDREQIDAYKAYLPKDLEEDEIQSSIEFTLNRSKWLTIGDIIVSATEGDEYYINNILDDAIEVRGLYKMNGNIKLIKDGVLPFYYKLKNTLE